MALPITAMVAVLVAGPAIRNTSAAPGDKPFIIKTAAMGMDPVAQTYSGMEATNTINILNHSLWR